MTWEMFGRWVFTAIINVNYSCYIYVGSVDARSLTRAHTYAGRFCIAPDTIAYAKVSRADSIAWHTQLHLTPVTAFSHSLLIIHMNNLYPLQTLQYSGMKSKWSKCLDQGHKCHNRDSNPLSGNSAIKTRALCALDHYLFILVFFNLEWNTAKLTSHSAGSLNQRPGSSMPNLKSYQFTTSDWSSIP